jgi:hypothetical protein
MRNGSSRIAIMKDMEEKKIVAASLGLLSAFLVMLLALFFVWVY